MWIPSHVNLEDAQAIEDETGRGRRMRIGNGRADNEAKERVQHHQIDWQEYANADDRPSSELPPEEEDPWDAEQAAAKWLQSEKSSRPAINRTTTTERGKTSSRHELAATTRTTTRSKNTKVTMTSKPSCNKESCLPVWMAARQPDARLRHHTHPGAFQRILLQAQGRSEHQGKRADQHVLEPPPDLIRADTKAIQRVEVAPKATRRNSRRHHGRSHGVRFRRRVVFQRKPKHRNFRR